MKKALFSLFLAIACLPAFAQIKSGVVVEQLELVRCTPFTWNITGETYDHDTVFTVIHPDTVYVLDLTIDPNGIIRDTVEISANCTYIWRDSLVFHESGLDSAIVNAVSGCDSIHYFDLTIRGDFDTLMLDTAVCGYYMAPWGERLTNDTIIDTTYTTTTGCQRRDSLNLMVYATYNMPPVIKEADCEYFWRDGNMTITDTLVHSVTKKTRSFRCDSVISIKVNMTFNIDTTFDTIVCDLYTAPWNTNYTSTQTIVHKDTSATKCITTTTVGLIVNNSFRDTTWALQNVMDTTIGCFLDWGDAFITAVTPTPILGTLKDVNRCDSIAAVRVTALTQVEHVDTAVTPCNHPYKWKPLTRLHTLNVDTICHDTNIAANCVTYYTLNLTFGDSISDKYANRVLRCEFDSLKIGTPRYSFRIENGDTVVRKYTGSGSSTVMSVVDIDSIYSYNTSKRCTTYFKIGLNIMQPTDTNRTDVVTRCDKYVSSTFGQTFYSSIDTTIIYRKRPKNTEYNADNWNVPQAVEDCYDREYRLKLTINPNDTIFEQPVTSCDRYTWPFNDTTYVRSINLTRRNRIPGTTTADTTALGCPVYRNLDLTINYTPVSHISGEWMLEPDGSTTLTAVSNASNLTYSWFINGAYDHDGETCYISDINNHENIDVMLTASNGNGCPDSNWVTITFAPIGIDDVEGVDVSIYPNPASRIVNLRAAEAIGTVAIYNAIGQQVLLRQGSGDTMQIDLYNLANGHYTMRIVTVEGHEAIRKFIVNK